MLQVVETPKQAPKAEMKNNPVGYAKVILNAGHSLLSFETESKYKGPLVSAS